MIGDTTSNQNNSNTIRDTEENSRRLKQKLKSTRLKKRLKNQDTFHEIPEDNMVEKDFICKVCGIVCDNKTDHTDHQERQHGVGKTNTCPLCLVVLEDRIKR